MNIQPKLLLFLIIFINFSGFSFAQIENQATPIENITVKKGFKIELLFTVPKERMGSWVNLCLNNNNRIIASDQFGGLYRFDVPTKGKILKGSHIEKIPVDIRAANGLLWEAPTQEEQMEYARSLRILKTAWNHELRVQYFNWFLKASNYRGGASFTKFIEFIRNDAVTSLNPTEQKKLANLLSKKAEVKSPAEVMAEAMAGRTFVKNWKLEELSRAASSGLKGRNFKVGRRIFAAGGCYACHRIGNQGGMNGPDLTGSGGRYSPHDLLEQIMYPSKEINEQFVPTFVTLKSGETLSGVVVNLNGDRVTLNTHLYNPNQRTSVQKKKSKA